MKWGKPQSATHLNEGDCPVRITEGLHDSLRWHEMGYAVGSRGLGLCLLIFKSIQKVLPPVLLVAVLNDGPQSLGPGNLFPESRSSEVSRAPGSLSPQWTKQLLICQPNLCR